MEVSQVREQADQPDQRQRHEGTDHADQRRHHAERDETRVGGIVAEPIVDLGISRHGRDTGNVIVAFRTSTSHLATVVAPLPRARVMARWPLRYRDDFLAVFRNKPLHPKLRRRPMPLPSLRRPRSAIGACTTLFLTLFAVACDHSPSGPGSTPIQFSRTVSLPDAQSLLQTGPTRVEVRVIPGTLVARRVELEESREMTRPEEVRSRVTAVTSGTDTATFTLEVGGLQIAANGTTMIRHGERGDDAAQSAMTLADFVALVQADIAAGHNPTLTASRHAPATPQGPDDGSFLAADLKLDEGNNHSVIKLNIAAANLVTNATPPPDGFLKVLGLSLELRLADGTTKLKQENPELEGVREFEGLVQSVDVTAQTVTLKDGTIIRIVAGTEFEGREGEGDDHVTGLPAVQDALTAGKTVRAEGRGLVDSSNPLTLDAIRIEFEVEGEELPPP